MSIVTLASGASAWRGYEYYTNKKVKLCDQLNDHEFHGLVKGSAKDQYHVHINLEHPRKSVCNCPHADGKRIICKHMVAVFFTAFPKEAETYLAEIENYEKEEDARQQELDDKVIKYINSMSKQELREALYEVLYSGEDWVFNRFVREKIGW